MQQPFNWPIWIGLNVDNLEEQISYYQNVVGLTPKKPGARSFIFPNGDALELNQANAENGAKGYSIAYQFPGETLGEFEAACKELQARGAKLQGKLQTYPDYAWGTFLDPEDNLYVIKWVKPSNND